MPGDLLEIMTSRLGKSSISDLRFVSADELLVGIKNMNLSEHTISEWNYVLSYIFDDTIKVDSYEGMQEMIKRMME